MERMSLSTRIWTTIWVFVRSRKVNHFLCFQSISRTNSVLCTSHSHTVFCT